MERPQLIYALPRSRGTAILQASKKLRKFPEPNNPHNLYLNKRFTFFVNNPNWKNELPVIKKWNLLTKEMSYRNAAVKILPAHFNEFPLSIEWYNRIQEEETHDVYVVHRDLKELCYSFILAGIFGWFKHEEKQFDGEVEVTGMAVDGLSMHFDSYLKYFPKNAKLISWESLPNTLFDKNNVIMEEQYSIKNFERIKNKDYCIGSIEDILRKYKPLIEEKTSSLEWVLC